jgi:hypothetical protein
MKPLRTIRRVVRPVVRRLVGFFGGAAEVVREDYNTTDFGAYETTDAGVYQVIV